MQMCSNMKKVNNDIFNPMGLVAFTNVHTTLLSVYSHTCTVLPCLSFINCCPELLSSTSILNLSCFRKSKERF